ncbi:type II secretion system F family protein [Spirillospora sp. NPDC047279]|uniref:type II secretion system F family protein n=1 Tax=Spirillospora sp. NPDC047279 TaxID=3155478 RepID=UPI0033F624C5
MTPILVLASAAALCVLVMLWGVALLTSDQRVAASAVLAPGKTAKDDVFILDAIADRLGAPLAGPAMDMLAPWRVKIRKRIDAAGRPGGLTVEGYARRTAGYVVLFSVITLLLVLNGQSLGLVCLLGCFQNELVLYGKRVARQDDIQRSMPDFLDVLAVTVSAGLSFRMALARVAESMPGALADEFLVALRQMELGTPRREAFEDLRARNNSEAVNQFVTALLQAEELGAPLGTALIDIGNDMRRESAQWARRKAQRATPKITGITMGMTLPALMMVVLGALFFGSGVGTSGIFGG